MRLDSANRSFLALMSLALLLGMYVLCGAVGSVLVPLVAARISQDGAAGLWIAAAQCCQFSFSLFW
jgi:hypothetical protein